LVLGGGHAYRHRDQITEVVSARNERVRWYVRTEVDHREARRS
jgi:hypothetical protein